MRGPGRCEVFTAACCRRKSTPKASRNPRTRGRRDLEALCAFALRFEASPFRRDAPGPALEAREAAAEEQSPEHRCSLGAGPPDERRKRKSGKTPPRRCTAWTQAAGTASTWRRRTQLDTKTRVAQCHPSISRARSYQLQVSNCWYLPLSAISSRRRGPFLSTPGANIDAPPRARRVEP